MPDPVFFSSAKEWRDWLAEHHDGESECLVGFIRVTTGRANMTWSEAVDEAICFGWIDGVRRGVDADTYSIRFTPRKPGSNWSAINVKKVEALRGTGRMTEAGERAFAQRSEAKTAIYSYEREAAEFSADQQRAFKSNAVAWEFWQGLPAGYRKVATHWVTRAKREATCQRRLEQLIEDSAAGRRLRHLSR
jgi:uncharacterized protein YdeI (YjbR/CyaY-like superfamily)